MTVGDVAECNEGTCAILHEACQGAEQRGACAYHDAEKSCNLSEEPRRVEMLGTAAFPRDL